MGDTAKGFKEVFAYDQLVKLPAGCKVILPTATKKPVTLNGGLSMSSWFDIKSSDSIFNQNRVEITADYLKTHFSQDEITESTDLLLNLIEEEVKVLGSSQ